MPFLPPPRFQAELAGEIAALRAPHWPVFSLPLLWGGRAGRGGGSESEAEGEEMGGAEREPPYAISPIERSHCSPIHWWRCSDGEGKEVVSGLTCLPSLSRPRPSRLLREGEGELLRGGRGNGEEVASEREPHREAHLTLSQSTTLRAPSPSEHLHQWIGLQWLRSMGEMA